VAHSLSRYSCGTQLERRMGRPSSDGGIRTDTLDEGLLFALGLTRHVATHAASLYNRYQIRGRQVSRHTGAKGPDFPVPSTPSHRRSAFCEVGAQTGANEHVVPASAQWWVTPCRIRSFRTPLSPASLTMGIEMRRVAAQVFSLLSLYAGSLVLFVRRYPTYTELSAAA
jgi:hypothetical protein